MTLIAYRLSTVDHGQVFKYRSLNIRINVMKLNQVYFSRMQLTFISSQDD